MAISDRRARLGRVQFYIEPRDAWVGVYVAPDAVYVCPLPFVVVKVHRGVNTQEPCDICSGYGCPDCRDLEPMATGS
jgi:hypothetical protein